MSVYKKLQDARIKLQNTQLEKTGHNKFAGYYYFELGDFLPSVQKIFSESGLCGVVSFTADIASLRIVDVTDEKEIVFTSPMGSANLKGCHEVQNVGAVETYQRRYLWVTAMEIVEHDAIDSTDKAEPAASKPAPVAPSLRDEDIDDIELAMRECTDVEGLQKIFGSAYPKGSKPQQARLKKCYDKTKTDLTKKEPA